VEAQEHLNQRFGSNLQIAHKDSVFMGNTTPNFQV